MRQGKFRNLNSEVLGMMLFNGGAYNKDRLTTNHNIATTVMNEPAPFSRDYLEILIKEILKTDGNVLYSNLQNRSRQLIFKPIQKNEIMSIWYANKKCNMFHFYGSLNNDTSLLYNILADTKFDGKPNYCFSLERSFPYPPSDEHQTEETRQNAKKLIYNAIESFIKFLATQNVYTIDDVEYYSALATFESLFFEFLMYLRDFDTFYRLAEALQHSSTNKRKSFTRMAKTHNSNPNKEYHLCDLDSQLFSSKDNYQFSNELFIYYINRFYKKYKDGILYTTAFKKESYWCFLINIHNDILDMPRYKSDMDDSYREFVNELKGKNDISYDEHIRLISITKLLEKDFKTAIFVASQNNDIFDKVFTIEYDIDSVNRMLHYTATYSGYNRLVTKLEYDLIYAPFKSENGHYFWDRKNQLKDDTETLEKNRDKFKVLCDAIGNWISKKSLTISATKKLFTKIKNKLSDSNTAITYDELLLNMSDRLTETQRAILLELQIAGE